MKFFLALLILTGVFHTHASAQRSLETCRKDFENPYHVSVNRHIDDAVALPSSLQLTTFPSFQVESGLRLVASEIHFVELRSSFWGDSYVIDRHGIGRMDFSKPKASVKSRHAPLNVDVARRIEHLYTKAITEATQSNSMGLDGVMYVFTTAKGSCAWAWSPVPGTRNARLVKLMRKLEKHTKFSSAIDLQRSEKTIIRLLDEIERTK